jgi:hypothetical protein
MPMTSSTLVRRWRVSCSGQRRAHVTPRCVSRSSWNGRLPRESRPTLSVGQRSSGAEPGEGPPASGPRATPPTSRLCRGTAVLHAGTRKPPVSTAQSEAARSSRADRSRRDPANPSRSPQERKRESGLPGGDISRTPSTQLLELFTLSVSSFRKPRVATKGGDIDPVAVDGADAGLRSCTARSMEASASCDELAARGRGVVRARRASTNSSGQKCWWMSYVATVDLTLRRQTARDPVRPSRARRRRP